MTKKIRKIYIDFEKEETWLNEMSAKGLHLKHYTWGCYHFEEGTPGAYIYRLEMLKNLPGHAESQNYVEFLEDSGIEVVATYFRWVFLRRPSAEGPFEVFTDVESKIRHFKMIRLFFGIIGGVNIYLGFTSFLNTHRAEIGLINLVVGLLFVPYFIKLTKKIGKLKQESLLHE